MSILEFLGEVGVPIFGAVVMAFFIFLSMKYIFDSVLAQIKSTENIISMLETRAKVMNNDILRIDLLVISQSQATAFPFNSSFQSEYPVFQGVLILVKFSEAAFKYSVAPTRELGGKITWQNISNLPIPSVAGSQGNFVQSEPPTAISDWQQTKTVPMQLVHNPIVLSTHDEQMYCTCELAE